MDILNIAFFSSLFRVLLIFRKMFINPACAGMLPGFGPWLFMEMPLLFGRWGRKPHFSPFEGDRESFRTILGIVPYHSRNHSVPFSEG